MGTVAVDTERLICAVAPFMPMNYRAQAHMGTLASKSCFGEQCHLRIFDSIFDFILVIAQGDAFMCFETYLLVSGGF